MRSQRCRSTSVPAGRHARRGLVRLVSVAQVDGVHAGDAVDVWLNRRRSRNLHAGLLG